MRSINKHSLILGLAVALVATACGSDPKTAQQKGPAAAPTATTAAVTATTAAVATTTTGQEGDGDGLTYATKAFNEPFDVAVPSWLPVAPSEEQPNFVTWVASDSDLAVRFLIPVNIYPPGGGDTIPPPEDYLTYLLGQTDHGAHFTDTTNTTVGGRPATIVTATVDDSLDGSLGCPEEGIVADECFGLQPDFVLRIAVIDAADKPLLIWLRNSADNPTIETEPFEQMLTTIRFSDRPVEAPATPPPPPAPVATPLDGTYSWTITKADALAHGTPNDKKPENLAAFPWDFTMTLNAGTWELRHHEGTGDFDDGSGPYTVDDSQVAFDWDGSLLTFTYSVDVDGTLHLDPQAQMNSGDAFVWATNPWTRIADVDGSGNNAAATPLDGTYRWTLTKEEAIADGHPTNNELASFPWVFTMTLNNGMLELRNQARDGDSAESGTYTVEGDVIAFTWETDGNTSTYTYSVDTDGTLHLEPLPPISNPGEPFVLSTNPWAKIG